jgi:hypothetical protein
MNREHVAQMLAKPISQERLGSSIPARLAYVGVDGEPRVIPIGFWWTGEHVVMDGQLAAGDPDVRAGALRRRPCPGTCC